MAAKCVDTCQPWWQGISLWRWGLPANTQPMQPTIPPHPSRDQHSTKTHTPRRCCCYGSVSSISRHTDIEILRMALKL